DKLLGLARGGLGQRPELDRVRALVVGQALTTEGDDLLLAHVGAGAQGDKRFRSLAPVRMGNADDRALEHGWMGADYLLDLDARDVLSSRDDDVLAAVPELDVSVWVPHPEVTRVKPAAAKCSLGRGLVGQVALHDVV